MSNIGAQAQRAKREVKEPEPVWKGHVLLMGPGGTRWARVALPESVMRAHLVADIEPPNMRGFVASRVESELMSDGFVDGRWPR